jgi:CPA1 family monovalent cation:H+ antiporter
LTLPPLIRALGLAGATGRNVEEEEARRAMVEAALSQLERSRQKDDSEFAAVYDEIEQKYKHRLKNLIERDESGVATNLRTYDRYLQVSRRLLSAERQTAVRLRNEGLINDEVLRKVERELDLTEMRLSLM